MKYIFLFGLLIVYSCLQYPQENPEDSILSAFIDTLQYYQPDAFDKFNKMNEKDFNTIIELTYKAIEQSPSAIPKITSIDIHFSTTFNSLMASIKDRYSYYIQTIVWIPIWVKANIIAKREVNNNGFRQINLTLKPEYVIKGKSPLLMKSEFEVYYREYYSVEKEKDYKIGESYLFPLWDRGEKENSIYAIATWVDGNGSRFLIKGGTLFDYFDFFGLGNEVKFEDIVNKLRGTIESIMNKTGLGKYSNNNNRRSK